MHNQNRQTLRARNGARDHSGVQMRGKKYRCPSKRIIGAALIDVWENAMSYKYDGARATAVLIPAVDRTRHEDIGVARASLLGCVRDVHHVGICIVNGDPGY